MIEIERISHTYPGTRKTPPLAALKEISLRIDTGEMVVFLGPNGSGKSTLLRILTTLLQPSSGSVRIKGLDLRRQARAVRRLLGVVFQKPALDDKMSVAENLWAAGRLYDIPRRELDGRLRRLLRDLGLEERRDERVDRLSGGLARRVELAKALLPEPALLVLDEPTSGLDPVVRQEFWRHLEALRIERKLTVVATTHLLDEARRCDRVAIVHRGHLLAFDEPARLQRRVGREVLSIRAERLEELQRELREFLQVEGTIVDHALRLSLSEHISLDELLRRFGKRIETLTLSHPSLDDVFVHFTGEHLSAGEER